MKNNFKHVRCDYTGGGIYVFSALWKGKYWIYGGLDNYFGCYSVPGEEIEAIHGCRYEDYEVSLPSGDCPTWRDVANAIRDNIPDSEWIIKNLIYFNPDLDSPVLESESEE